MKKYILLLIVPFLLISTGCEPEEEEEEDNCPDCSSLIIGHWSIDDCTKTTISVTTSTDPVYGNESTTTTNNTSYVGYPVYDPTQASRIWYNYYTFQFDGIVKKYQVSNTGLNWSRELNGEEYIINDNELDLYLERWWVDWFFSSGEYYQASLSEFLGDSNTILELNDSILVLETIKTTIDESDYETTITTQTTITNFYRTDEIPSLNPWQRSM